MLFKMDLVEFLWCIYWLVFCLLCIKESVIDVVNRMVPTWLWSPISQLYVVGFLCVFFCLWLTILSIYKWCSIQVASIIRRLLPEVSPAHFAKLTGVTTLPANDLSILTQSSDKLSDSRLEDSVGILDIFLACICKALTVQSKVKGGGGKIPGLEGRGTQSLTLAKLLQM